MANIERIQGKTGDTYRITVAGGFDTFGKRIRHRTTYKPSPGMTARQIEKAVHRAATDFERSIEQGYMLDNKQTFAKYADYVLNLKEHNGDLKVKTLDRYREYLPRINQAIGHIQLVDLRPQHLNSFYKNLAEDGIRADNRRATASVDLITILKRRKLSRTALSKEVGISVTTAATAVKGESISIESAEAIAKALGKPTKELFKISNPGGGLSNSTIMGHHRLISSVLSQAEKEMLVPYNAAKKASPPKIKKEDPNYFQPEEVAKILEALEKAPLKWQAITNLLIVTGCRRGEIAGIKLEKLDLEAGILKVDEARLTTKSKGAYTDSTKTENCRYLHLPNETIQLIREYRKEQRKLQMANGDRWQNTGYLFTQDNGLPIHPDSITKWLGNFSAANGLPHINPHAFRHTVASVLLANNTDVVTVSKQLGHASINTTENFYSHIIEENKAKASDCIAEVLLRKRA